MIPKPAIDRLCRIYTTLVEMDTSDVTFISSGELEHSTGIPANSIRKDISYLGKPGPGGGKYRIHHLRKLIEETLKITRKPKVCMVGIGQIGRIILEQAPENTEFEIIAGFDSNINIIEMTETVIDLFPSYQIPEKVRELNIELAILSVPDTEVEKSVNRLNEGGIKGILNYTSVPVAPEYGITVRNMSLFEELRILGVQTTQDSNR